MDGYAVATRIRAEEGPGNHVPIIMLTSERDVQQKVRALRAGADDYLIKPFHPAELLARMKSLIARFAPSDSLVGRPPMGRIHAYYGAKGGVGTTTIAINAAIALQSLGRRVCLVDGNLQFGDHRVFLDLGLDRKSIVDVVSAPAMDSDLIRKVVQTHDTGVDLLLAPPSPESADLVTPGHMHQVLELLRGQYDYIIVDIDKRLDDVNLMVLDVAETIFAVMTADLSCLKNVRMVLDTIGHLGYEQEQAEARPQPLERLHRHQREERGGRAAPPDRAPDRERVPGRDLRPQQRGAVHGRQGGLGAGPVGARLRAGGRSDRRGEGRPADARRGAIARRSTGDLQGSISRG